MRCLATDDAVVGLIRSHVVSYWCIASIISACNFAKHGMHVMVIHKDVVISDSDATSADYNAWR